MSSNQKNKFSPQQADGVLKEPELSVFLDLALLLDVVLYHLFVAVCADRADEIAVRPKLAAPQLLFASGHKVTPNV